MPLVPLSVCHCFLRATASSKQCSSFLNGQSTRERFPYSKPIIQRPRRTHAVCHCFLRTTASSKQCSSFLNRRTSRERSSNSDPITRRGQTACGGRPRRTPAADCESREFAILEHLDNFESQVFSEQSFARCSSRCSSRAQGYQMSIFQSFGTFTLTNISARPRDNPEGQALPDFLRYRK
jgi:hypothetical protein